MLKMKLKQRTNNNDALGNFMHLFRSTGTSTVE